MQERMGDKPPRPSQQSQPSESNLVDEQVKAALAEAKLLDQLPLSLREESGEVSRFKRDIALARVFTVASGACLFVALLGGAVMGSPVVYFLIRWFIVLGIIAIIFRVDAAIVDNKRMRRIRMLNEMRKGKTPHQVADEDWVKMTRTKW